MTVQGLPASATATTASPSGSSPLHDLIVIGGGAAGFMAAITAAEQGLRDVLVLEATPDPLSKVNTFVEFIFILLIVVNLLLDLNALVVETFAGLVIALSLLSLIKYVLIWSERVLRALRLVN